MQDSFELFPMLEWRDGPLGSRVGLRGGMDVWEAIGIEWAYTGDIEAILRDYEGVLTLEQIEECRGYYALFPDDIDARLRRNSRSGTASGDKLNSWPPVRGMVCSSW